MAAKKRHSNDDEIQPVQAGGGVAQGIVELLSASSSGLVFWSRHPFEVTAELQLRVRSAALPFNDGEPAEEWTMKRGFVVQCQPARRPNGAVGFQVSVLFAPDVTQTHQPSVKAGRMVPAPGDLDSALIRRLSGLN